jgi:hypothetical protein
VTGGWKKLNNEVLHNFYSSPNISRMMKSRTMRWAGHVARIREMRKVHRILVGMPEVKMPLGRSCHKYVDNIKMNLNNIVFDDMERIDLAEDRDQWMALVNTVMNLQLPKMLGIS